MRKTFILTVLAILIGVGASVGWLVFGEIQTSEAVHFDESIGMVHHQTERMSVTLANTRSVVEEDVSGITNITELLNTWTPRYNRAHSAYLRFDAAINLADEQAEAYFVSQRTLTQRYRDETLRAQATAHDDADYELYGRWRDRAHQARSNARSILDRLDDMDTNLQKLKLSSEMSFDAGGFNDVPLAITNLEAELSQFQTASDSIRAITASPFAGGT